MNYKIAVFGVKDTSEYMANYLAEHGHKPGLMITIDEAVASRNDISGLCDLSAVAGRLGMDIYKAPDYSLSDEKTKKFFAENSFDIGISMGWQRIIPGYILNAFRTGIYGFHGSCGHLPYGRGRSPLNWTVIKGDTRFINHFFKYSEVADWGSIYSVRAFEVNPHDTIRTLQYKAMLAGCAQALELVKNGGGGGLSDFKFDEGAATWYQKRTAADGKITFDMKTRQIYNLVRGVTKPFPGAFMECGDLRVQVWQVYPFDQMLDFSKYQNGEIIEIFDNNPIMKTVDGSIIVTSYESPRALTKGMRFQ